MSIFEDCSVKLTEDNIVALSWHSNRIVYVTETCTVVAATLDLVTLNLTERGRLTISNEQVNRKAISHIKFSSSGKYFIVLWYCGTSGTIEFDTVSSASVTLTAFPVQHDVLNLFCFQLNPREADDGDDWIVVSANKIVMISNGVPDSDVIPPEKVVDASFNASSNTLTALLCNGALLRFFLQYDGTLEFMNEIQLELGPTSLPLLCALVSACEDYIALRSSNSSSVSVHSIKSGERLHAFSPKRPRPFHEDTDITCMTFGAPFYIGQPPFLFLADELGYIDLIDLADNPGQVRDRIETEDIGWRAQCESPPAAFYMHSIPVSGDSNSVLIFDAECLRAVKWHNDRGDKSGLHMGKPARG